MNVFNYLESKLKRFQLRGSFFTKSFILILLITSIPGLITGVGIYLFAVSNVEDELMELHYNQIEERANNIDKQLKYLEYSTSRWAFDPRFGEELGNIDFVKQFWKTHDLSNLLLLLGGSHSLIKEVNLYVDSQDSVLFDSEYNVLTDETKEVYKSWLNVEKNIHWEQFPDNKKEVPSALTLVHNLPATSPDPFGAIVVTIDKSKMLGLLKTLTPYNEGATMLLDGENQVILSSNSSKDPTFLDALNSEMKTHKKNKGSFQFDYKNNVYSVSFGHFTRIDSEWTYVSAAPITSITAPLVFVSKLILIISVSALILGIILAWLASYKIYSPIGKLVHKLMGEETLGNKKGRIKDEFLLIEQRWQEVSQESHLLQDRMTEHVEQLKNSFILQLIQGFLYHYNETDLRKRMENYDWELTDQSFVALNVQLTGLHDSNVSFSNNDESLVSFVAYNIMEELADEYFQQFNVIKFPDLSIGMLVLYPTGTKVHNELHQFADEITKAINQILKMQVTITISSSTDSVKKISYLFEEVSTGKRFRSFENRNQIIDLQSKEHTETISELHYPFAIEKEVIQAIRMGQVEEVTELITKFLAELTERGSSEVNIRHGVIQLYSSIQHEILHSGIHPHDLFEGRNMYEELSQIHDIERINKWFTDKVILPYIEKLEGRLNIELKRLIEKVMTTIQENYMHDISLENCADEIGSNPYSLSKAFKQVVGINFIDYLTALRIDKAKDLLLQTDLKISDIAEQVGYRHSYFNRIFKKQMGVPPSQFRKQYQVGSEIKKEG